MSKKQRDTGSRFEREMARRLGVRRNLRADYSESAPDMETDNLVVECKYRAQIMVVRWLEQAERYAADIANKVPVVFARERGDRRPIAVLRAEDFLAILNARDDLYEAYLDVSEKLNKLEGVTCCPGCGAVNVEPAAEYAGRNPEANWINAWQFHCRTCDQLWNIPEEQS